MLLIHAPLTKSCEPPAALGYLSSAIQSAGLQVVTRDLNLEGLRHLLQSPLPTPDTWTKRAAKNLTRNLQTVRDKKTYQNRDRYHRTVSDINRVLEQHGKSRDLQLSLSNYTDPDLSPLKSADLRRSAHEFSENIFYPFFRTRIPQLIEKHEPHHIGFSLSFLSQALTTFAMIGFIKSNYPGIKILLGGGLVTTWFGNQPADNAGIVTSHPFRNLIDYVVSGPAGKAMQALFERPLHVPSAPDYGELHEHSYLAPGFILPYAASSGCYWRKCSFCPETSEGNSYSQVPPDIVAADLQKLAAQYQPALIHLLDNGIPPATLTSIAGIPPGAPWYGFVRFEKQLENLDFCKALKNSGCVMLKLGLESGDQAVLDALQKGIDLQRVETILDNLHAAGISTYVYLLFGTPVETRESAMKTMEFIKRHHDKIGFLNLAVFNLPVGSHEASHLQTSLFYDADLMIYQDFNHPQGWNRTEVRRFLDTVFKKDVLISSIVHRDPPYFTSNHAPFLI